MPQVNTRKNGKNLNHNRFTGSLHLCAMYIRQVITVTISEAGHAAGVVCHWFRGDFHPGHGFLVVGQNRAIVAWVAVVGMVFHRSERCSDHIDVLLGKRGEICLSCNRNLGVNLLNCSFSGHFLGEITRAYKWPGCDSPESHFQGFLFYILEFIRGPVTDDFEL